jgi:transcription initiation factor TFIIIB Brf1 subunit/transcription initiation factor TFIIB
MEMSQALALDEEVREKIWNIVKIQLSVETHLLVNRMIDQMVMCAIYGVCKVQPGMQITFNQIITKYCDLFKN